MKRRAPYSSRTGRRPAINVEPLEPAQLSAWIPASRSDHALSQLAQRSGISSQVSSVTGKRSRGIGSGPDRSGRHGQHVDHLQWPRPLACAPLPSQSTIFRRSRRHSSPVGARAATRPACRAGNTLEAHIAGVTRRRGPDIRMVERVHDRPIAARALAEHTAPPAPPQPNCPRRRPASRWSGSPPRRRSTPN